MLLAAETFLLAVLTTALLTPLLIRLGWRLNVLDLPGVRKVHRDPMPRLGGLAIFCGFILSLAGGFAISGSEVTLLGRVDYNWIGFLVGAVLVVACGIVDDVRGLGATSKFTVQSIAATICYYSGFRMTVLGNPFDGEFHLGVLSFPFTLLWVVGITNAVNMIDGLDGLAGGVSLIVTTTVGAISLVRGQFGVLVLCIALAGSLLGFLCYNLNPARIFMGDSGSMFLGFSLAVMAMRGSQKSATAVAILVPALALGLPALDTLLVMGRRAWVVRGDNRGRGLWAIIGQARRIFLADREHVHHNLMELGLSPSRSVLLLYVICLLFALTAFSMVMWNSVPLGSILACFSVGSVVAIKLLVMIRRRDVRRVSVEMRSSRAQEASGAHAAVEG